jgi:hypothetical protein
MPETLENPDSFLALLDEITLKKVFNHRAASQEEL